MAKDSSPSIAPSEEKELPSIKPKSLAEEFPGVPADLAIEAINCQMARNPLCHGEQYKRAIDDMNKADEFLSKIRQLKQQNKPSQHPEYSQFTRQEIDELEESRLKATKWKREKRFELYNNALKKKEDPTQTVSPL